MPRGLGGCTSLVHLEMDPIGPDTPWCEPQTWQAFVYWAECSRSNELIDLTWMAP